MTSFPDLAVRFVADLVPERAPRSRPRRSGSPARAARELLARDDVEIAVNLTVPAAHAAVGSAALAPASTCGTRSRWPPTQARPPRCSPRPRTAGLLVGCAPDTLLGPGCRPRAG